jgi:S1-C subfamily serine protease
MRGAVASSTGARGSDRVRISRLAIASLVCAIAGIPLFGLVTGLVAVLLAVLALGAIHSGARRGIGLAVPGLLLGILDVAGWAYLLSVVPWHAVASDAMFSDPPPDLASIQELDPPLQRAMRANVLIRRQHGLALLGGRAIGSGVILRVEGGDALIVTNRHVVDARFPSDHDGGAAQLARLDRLTVRILGQPDTEGRVIWMAPGQIDLALVRAPCSSTSMGQAAPWEKGRTMRVGEPVFAIGNPHELGWTHTQGVISQFRNRTYDSRRIRIIQTQAAINPGNSGGGLYDQQGYCLGINTWTADKSISEGIGFAIALDTLFDLAPPPLAVSKEKAATAVAPGPAEDAARHDRARPPEASDHVREGEAPSEPRPRSGSHGGSPSRGGPDPR